MALGACSMPCGHEGNPRLATRVRQWASATLRHSKEFHGMHEDVARGESIPVLRRSCWR